jgi:hypothetical protein
MAEGAAVRTVAVHGIPPDHVGILFDDLLGHPRSIDFAGHPAIVCADVVADGPAKHLKSLTEGLGMPLSLPVIRPPHPYCDLTYAPWLPRAASGQAAAAPPSVAKNFRRAM